LGQLRKLIGQTAIYGLSSIIGRVLNYLLVPLYTQVFDPGEYGIVTDFYAYVAFFNVLYLFGLETTYFRMVNKQGQEPDEVFNKLQTLIVINALLITSVLLAGATTIVNAFGYAGQEQYVYILSAVMFIDAVVALPFAKLRHEGKAFRFASMKLINIALVICLNVFFVIWCPNLISQGHGKIVHYFYDPGLGVGYVFIANLLANGFYLLLMGDLLLKLRITFPLKSIKVILQYCFPIMLLGLAGVTNEMLSRAILKFRLPVGFYEGLSNLDVLGIFGACYKLSVFMALSIQAFKYAAEPFFFKSAGEKKSPVLFSQVMNGYIIFASLLLMGVVVNLSWISQLFLRKPAYIQALPTVPWLLLGGIFLGIYYNLSIWFKITDRTLYGAYISGTGALLTILLNWWLIPHYGYMASAVITAFIYLLMASISYLIGQKYYKIPYQVWKGLSYICIIFLLSMALFYYPISSSIFGSIINNLIVLLVAFAILKIEQVNLAGIFRKTP